MVFVKKDKATSTENLRTAKLLLRKIPGFLQLSVQEKVISLQGIVKAHSFEFTVRFGIVDWYFQINLLWCCQTNQRE